MTARQWTREELDRAHPDVKAEGWTWALWDNGKTPVAMAADQSRWVVVVEGRLVCADEGGDLIRPLASIALAVILASKGLDSLGAMADELDGFASHEGGDISTTPQDAASGAYRHAALMLRRGTVEP